MSSGVKVPDEHTTSNEVALGSPMRLTNEGQQGPYDKISNQFMNPMINQSVEGDGSSSGDEQNNRRVGHKKKRYHRHTEYQIQELETYFKKCPHPDDKQRKILSLELGLDPSQIKFWFQNKRTQMKMQHERNTNTQLRAENERLQAENTRLKDKLRNSSCLNCGGPTAAGDRSFDEHHLDVENARLRKEIEQMEAIAAKRFGKPMPLIPPPRMPKIGSPLVTGAEGEPYVPAQLVRQMGVPKMEIEKHMIVEVAGAAIEEFLRMVQVVEPLWMPAVIDGNSTYVLNEDEYFRAFPRPPFPRFPGFRWEATRHSAVVMMNHAEIVKSLMNVNLWAAIFCGIVAKATPLELLSTGVAGNYDGALQVMNVEFQLTTPLVPTRETVMARISKQYGEGIWAVVDVSLDELQAISLTKFRKRPSGCLIQQLPNGFSKITWIEHIEMEKIPGNSIYRSLINSGAAFGAKYWLSSLYRHCERAACAIATEFPRDDIHNIEGRRRILKLAERMVISFCSSTSASSRNTWTSLSHVGNDEVKVMTHKSNNGPGQPNSVAINVATSLWLPAAPKMVFDYFCDENCRDKWDILTKGTEIFKMAHITTGEQPGNCVALLRIRATSENQRNTILLQESFTLPTGCFVVYAPINLLAMNKVLDGGDSNEVALLPSGFAILPDGSVGPGYGLDALGSGGTLLTMAFQILVNSSLDAYLSLSDASAVTKLISGTIERVKSTFGGIPNP